MARPKNQDKRRKDLLLAAERVLAKKGISSFTRKDIAMETGLTGPAVSYYFPDLNELLEDVYHRAFEQFFYKYENLKKEIQSPWALLEKYVEIALPFGKDDINSLIMYQFSGEPRFSVLYSRLSSRLHQYQAEFIAGIIEKGNALKEFKTELSTQEITRCIIALIDSYGLQIVLEESGIGFEFAKNEILKLASFLLGRKA